MTLYVDPATLPGHRHCIKIKLCNSETGTGTVGNERVCTALDDNERRPDIGHERACTALDDNERRPDIGHERVGRWVDSDEGKPTTDNERV